MTAPPGNRTKRAAVAKRRPPPWGRRGPARLLAAAVAAVSLPVAQATTEAAHGRPLGLLLRGGSNSVGKARTLGVNDHLDGPDPGFRPGGNGLLDRNKVLGDSMAYDFPFLDDLKPVAPMDKVYGTDASPFMPNMPGEHHNAMFVPSYLYPDPFPAVRGRTCNCRPPPKTESTQEQEDWAKQAAKMLGVDRKELKGTFGSQPKAACTCTDIPSDKGLPSYETWRFAKWEPVPGSDNFTVTPADITFNDGDYWPNIATDNLAAPEDKLPVLEYPLMAPGDRFWPVPATAQEDRIALRFAKYIDQVEKRERDCDLVSNRCTTGCKPGDEVQAHLGNVVLPAKVLKTFPGNAVAIQYVPTAAKLAQEAGEATMPCDLGSRCSLGRVCNKKGSFCRPKKYKMTQGTFGEMKRSSGCPQDTTVCSFIQQIVSATFLVAKDGKTCRAAPKDKPKQEDDEEDSD